MAFVKLLGKGTTKLLRLKSGKVKDTRQEDIRKTKGMGVKRPHRVHDQQR